MTSIRVQTRASGRCRGQPAFKSCGLTPRSEYMVAKPTSGTGQGRNPGCVTFCRDKLKRWILTQGCGEDPEQGSKCWGLLWVTRTLSTNIWNGPGRSTLLRRIPTRPDVQLAWLLLLHCASTRANYLLRVVRPEWAGVCRAHDQEVWECLCHILTVPTGPESVARASTTLPLAMADALPMIRERHPEVADLIV